VSEASEVTVGRRPRLVVVASTFPGRPGDGTPEFVRDLSLRLGKTFETVVLVPRVPGAPTHERLGDITVERFAYFPRRWEKLAHGAMLDNLRLHRLRWLQVPPFLVAEALSLRRLIRRHQPDVLHLHWIIPQGITALLVGRRVPWVVTAHGADLYAMDGPIARRVKRMILRRAAEVTGGNPEMYELLIAHGANPATTHLQPMGAEIEQFRELAGNRTPIPGRILFVGRLSEKKGVSVLLDAVRQLPGDLGWSLEVAGDGALRADLEEQAEGLDSVTFLGAASRQRLAVAYAEASVVVVPSVRASSGDQDAMPLVILEAMGVGRPVVASDLSGLDVAVTHEKTGLLVPPGDPGALAGALRRVLTDETLRIRLGEAAAVRSNDFTVETCAKQFVELLTAATRGPGPS
jgi:glycosyltransferase involved in cell wall biosynthesis